MRLMTSLTVTALAITGLALGPATAAGAATSAEKPVVAPAPCSPMSFDSAAVVTDAAAKTVTLIVRGVKPSSNIEVRLTPVTYVRQPEYWMIMVDGCAQGIGLPVLTPYVAKLDVTSTIGTIGIKVRGRDHGQLIPIKPVR